MAVTDSTKNFDVVPTELVVRAMRDNGYQNAAYALAELIDNSIQAGANTVELLCSETEEQLASKRRRRIHEIAVLDNGKGMNAEVLRMALQFGNGTHLNDRSGIGRFGMGLPNSSISQCRRVDVWSWQSGIESAFHSYLDIGEIERGSLKEVPPPKPNRVPEFWKTVGQSFDVSGTLVVWSQLDRCYWKTAKAIIDNSELLIGRMYRKFINEGRCVIRLAQMLVDSPQQVTEKAALANDPMYLMSRTSCPPPWHDQPMFQPFGEINEHVVRVEYNGAIHEVKTRYSHAKKEAREDDNAGARPHGRHAAKNVGVSIVRAGRELELSHSWVIEYDPRERWWGVEIEFPPELDEVFGVTNNKQSARYLSKAGEFEIEEFLKNSKLTLHQLKDQLEEDGDPIGPALEVSSIIERNLKSIRNLLKTQSLGQRRKTKRHEIDAESPERKGTRVVRDRQQEGYQGSSDQDESKPAEERIEVISEELVEQGLTPDLARDLAASTVSNRLKYIFHENDLETSAFFSIKLKGGAILITLNTAHPAYTYLLEAKELPDSAEDIDATEDPSELKQIALEQQKQLQNTTRGLRLLLEAWARYEDEQPEGPRRTAAQEARSDWGRVARQFLADGP